MRIREDTQNHIVHMAWSPCGTMLAVTSFAQSLLWDLNNRFVIERLNEYNNFVTGVTWTKDSKNILTYKDERIYLRDTESGKTLEVESPHSKAISTIQTHSNSKYMVSAAGNEIVIWDTQPLEILSYLPMDTFSAHSTQCLSYSPDGSLFAAITGHHDDTITVFSSVCGKVLKTFQTGSINCLTWLPYKNLIVTGCVDEKLCFYDYVTGKLVEKRCGEREYRENHEEQNKYFEGDEGDFYCFSQSFDNKFFSAMTWDGIIYFYSMESLKIINRISTGVIESVGCAFNPTKNIFAAVGPKTSVNIYEYNNDFSSFKKLDTFHI